MATIKKQQTVMHHAHIIYNAGGCNWSEALQAAWDLHYLRRWFALGVAEFTYTKQDGTIRTARGTLCTELIPPSAFGKEGASDAAGGIKAPPASALPTTNASLVCVGDPIIQRKPNYKSIAYYDLDKEDWRSFSIENFGTLDRLLYLKSVEP